MDRGAKEAILLAVALSIGGMPGGALAAEPSMVALVETGRSADRTVHDAAASTDAIVIDGDARFTDSRSVTIDVGPASGGRTIELVRLASERSGDELLDPVDAPGLDAIPWTLPAGDDGPRAVHARVRFSTGEWSGIMSDEIRLDTTAPTGVVLINEGAEATGDPWGASANDWPILHMVVRDESFRHGGTVARTAIGKPGGPWTEYKPDPGQRADGDQIRYIEFWDIFDDYGDYPRGDVTVSVRWRDEAGNLSEPVTDSIVFRQYLPVGRLYVDDQLMLDPADEPDPASRNEASVRIRIRIDELPVSSGGEVGRIRSVRVSGKSDGPWKEVDWTGDRSMSFAWSLTDRRYGYGSDDGVRSVHVRLVPSIGLNRHLVGRVILDRVTPTSDAPVAAVAIGSVVGEDGTVAAATGTNVKGSVSWKGRDRGDHRSGIRRYRLQRSTGGGSWKDQDLAKATATKATQGLAASRTYRFRVRATDRAGNSGSWNAGLPFEPTIIQESSSKIRYSCRWIRRSHSQALGGRLRTTTASGASATLTFRGTGVAWVAPRQPDGDSVEVWVDGRKVKTAQLTASEYQPRRVVFSTAWKKSGRHTIKLVHRYPGHELPLDAFIVLE